MILPTRFEPLNDNITVIGAFILKELEKSPFSIPTLFNKMHESYGVEVNSYLNSIAFLWLAEFINFKNNFMHIKR